MAIKNEKQRSAKATMMMLATFRNPTAMDLELFRIAVEFGASLAPLSLNPKMLVQQMLGMEIDSKINDTTSLLLSLFQVRPRVPPATLPELDELTLFVIDEMVRRNVDFMGIEVSVGLLSTTPLNPKIVRVLLETNKFDANQNFVKYPPPPLLALLGVLMDLPEVPSASLDCLHFLLNWKGIDVNTIWRRQAAEGMVENHVLDYVRHPEIARILIRHGANVNQVTAMKGVTNVDTHCLVGEKQSNVLHSALADPFNPNQEELLRLYIRSGARLLANGKDGKSSSTLFFVARPSLHLTTKQWSAASEEVLHMILQLNQQQGLLVRWQNPENGDDHPLLHLAVSSGSSARVVQILCAMHPEQMEVNRSYLLVGRMLNRIGNDDCPFEESMNVLGVLLEHGFRLLGRTCPNDFDCFVGLWLVSTIAKRDLKLLQRTIEEKRGEEEFRRCAHTLMALPEEELTELTSSLFQTLEQCKKLSGKL